MKNNEYPILVFPRRDEVGRTTRPTPVKPPHIPTAKENARRMSPKFQNLQKVLEGRKMHIQQGAEGADPEDVLVIETVGAVEDFYKAVQKIEGFEWLFEADDLRDPDEDFYATNSKGVKTDKKLSTRLYLVSTNTTALNNMVSLYDRYVEDTKVSFDRGLGKFKDVFKLLSEVRYWNAQDRLDGSSFMEDWLRENELDKSINFQIELWYRDNEKRRAKAEHDVVDLVETSGGKVIGRSVIADIRYHALLVQVPGDKLRDIVYNLDDSSLIQCRDVMFFKAMPQTAYGSDVDDETTETGDSITITATPMLAGKPVVALLDGYPMENHMYLANRLVVEDPDGYNDEKYLAEYRKHGTEMASLIIHGDLSKPWEPMDTPLYVRPIMKPDLQHPKKLEQIPENVLLVDLIHRAVRRIFEGEGHSPADAPTVKIINFSIGDSARKFCGTMSPLARLLDWLSYKYNVLFVISAGNVEKQVFPAGCSLYDFKRKGQNVVSQEVSKMLLDKQMDYRLLSPAESINNITVGSVHKDRATPIPNDPRVNPYVCLHPALYTPFGGGFRKAVKPDLVFDGGRQMIEDDFQDRANLYPSYYKRSPGLRVAWPVKDTPTLFDRGTSCTAALMSRHAYECYKEVREILALNDKPETNIHLLVKALVAHGCSWGEVAENIQKFLPAGTENKAAKSIKRRWIGYGYPDLDKSLMCNPKRVTVLGFGELKDGEAHVYQLPLPKSMDNVKVLRRVTVTLAWMSQIAPQNQRYRKTKLWFELTDNKDFVPQRIDVADENIPKAGTLQHEIFVGERVKPLPENATLGIKVNCMEDAGKFNEPAKYAIAVSLEWGEGISVELIDEINIYQEVKDMLRVPVTVPIH